MAPWHWAGRAGHQRNQVRPGGDRNLVLLPGRPCWYEVPGPGRTRVGLVQEAQGPWGCWPPARRPTGARAGAGCSLVPATSADFSRLRRELGSGNPVHAGWRVKAQAGHAVIPMWSALLVEGL